MEQQQKPSYDDLVNMIRFFYRKIPNPSMSVQAIYSQFKTAMEQHGYNFQPSPERPLNVTRITNLDDLNLDDHTTKNKKDS